MYETICFTLHACVNNCSLASCDYNNCVHKGLCWFIDGGCSTNAEWVDDPSGTGLPPGGTVDGGGGGPSGCNACPGNIPPKDDCALQDVFYRMVTGCNTPPGDDGDLIDDACAKILTENIKAKNLLNITVVNAQNTNMKVGIATAAAEKGFIFGKDSVGNYQTSGIFVGATNSQVDLPPTDPNFTAEGGVHNHTIGVYDITSTGDVYWFMQNNYINNNFDNYYTNAASGAVYACVITNQTDFDQFPLSYPPS